MAPRVRNNEALGTISEGAETENQSLPCCSEVPHHGQLRARSQHVAGAERARLPRRAHPSPRRWRLGAPGARVPGGDELWGY